MWLLTEEEKVGDFIKTILSNSYQIIYIFFMFHLNQHKGNKISCEYQKAQNDYFHGMFQIIPATWHRDT